MAYLLYLPPVASRPKVTVDYMLQALCCNSNMAAIHFPKPEVVLSQPCIEISNRNLVRKYIFNSPS